MVPEWFPWPESPVEGIWGREKARAVGLRHDVTVLTTRPTPGLRSLAYSVSEHREDGLRVIRARSRRTPSVKLSYLFRVAAMLGSARALARAGFRPDVVHASVFVAALPALLIARRFGVPLVISEHYTGFPRGTVTGLNLRIARFTFERAAFVCPDSADLGRHIAELQIDARIRPLPNVVDTSVFAPPAHREVAATFRLLNVASLHPKKGHDHLLVALKRLDEERTPVTLDIVGDGPERSRLEARSAELGIRRRVVFHGNQPKERVASMMRSANLFVLPSVWENAPHVLIEAMASGLPSVATDVGGVAEIVDDEVGLTVPSEDPRALADAIAAVCDRLHEFDPHTLAERAEARYGYDAVAGQWSEVYRDAIAGSSRAPARAAQPAS